MISKGNLFRLVLLVKRLESNFPRQANRLKFVLRACKDGKPCQCNGNCSCKDKKKEQIEGIPMYESITQETLF